MVTYLTPVGAALVGLVAGLLVAARLAGRPLASFWRFRVERRRDWLVPALTALTCAALAIRFGASAELPAYLYLAVVSMALAAIDVEEHRLPNVLTMPSYLVALALLGVAALVVESGSVHFVKALFGLVGLWLIYLVLHMINPSGMGWGDVKLAGVLGAYLGWLGSTAWVVGAFLGVMFGGVVALVLLATRRVTAKTPIPFGPFMIAGALVAVLASALI